MAKKSSPIEDLFVIVRRLPWWLALLLAIVSYLYLHGIAVGVQLPASEGAQVAVTSLFAWDS